MTYHITRGGQSYGPYTLADLQRYVASGHVLLSDLAKSDEMAEAVPVSQILNQPGVPPVTPPVPPSPEYGASQLGYTQSGYTQSGYTAPGYVPPGYVPPGYPPAGYAPAGAYPNPPNLHWGLVLLFGILTCGLFMVVWELVQSAWMKKVAPQSRAIVLYAVADVVYLFVFSSNFMRGYNHTHVGYSVLFQLTYAVLSIWARFSLRASLEEHFNTAEPLGLSLSGIMTFFFGTLYFQWHMTRINQVKMGVRYPGMGV